MENVEVNNKSKIVKLMIIVIILIVIALAGTYALTIWRSQENTELTLRIGDISGIYCETGDPVNISNLGPIFDYEIDGEVITFSIDNQTNEVVKTSATFNITTITDNLKEESFKYKLLYSTNNTTYELLKEGSFKDVTSGSKIELLENYDVAISQKRHFKLIIYIDGNMENPITMQGGSLVGYLTACKIVEVDKSGANTPALTDALIPVMYDETTSTWVKADSSNNDLSWYNYGEKKWANAVLVCENGTRYATADKTVNISNNTTSVNGYTSNNKGVKSSTATSTFTIVTGTTSGTLSFDYSVSSEANYDKLTITVNGTTVANAISGEQSNTYSVSATASTTYTIVATYTKDSSGDKGADTASISNIVMPTGSTISVTNGDTYYFAEGSITTNHNQIGDSFKYENNKYILQNVTSGTTISSSVVGKYICPNITQTECTTMYKITEASTNITKVSEYTNVSIVNGVRTTYQSASAGTTIADEDILAFYVWIPRYKYKVWNKDKVIGTQSYNAQTTGIDIVFEDGTSSTGTISCTYSYAAPSSTAGSPNETCTGNNGDYYTHPAFTFGNQELTGFWMGKFELSSSNPATGSSYGGGNSTTLTSRILPNVTSWRKNTVDNFWKVIYDMQTSDNIYGLPTSRTNIDSHMLTNMEWGAVAYLTNSKYGRCTNGSCLEVSINGYGEKSNYTTMTGCGPISSGSTSTGTTCNAYNTILGQTASTTGNITGVYDMSGGASEYVMGNISSSNGTTYTYYAQSAGSNFTYSTDTAKYLIPYAYGTTTSDQKAYNRGRLGDATSEVVSRASYGWYNDYASFPFSSSSWFPRGGGFLTGSKGGPFSFFSDSGTSYNYSSGRAALLVLL